jgi:hypothetical protein
MLTSLRNTKSGQGLSVGALTATGALLWGGCLLFLGGLNLIWPTYGVAFLDVWKSVYPGYGAARGWESVLLGTVYGALDGALAGALVGWLYNGLAAPSKTVPHNAEGDR